MLRRQLGNIVVDRIIESEWADPFYDPIGFFPETTPEQWERHTAWMQPRSLDPVSGKLILPIQSFLERSCGRDVLVWGSHFPSPSLGHIAPRGDAFWFEYEERS